MVAEGWKEKRQQRLAAWRAGADEMEFASPEVKEKYLERMSIIIDALDGKKPARVPICPAIGFFPAFYGGITAEDAMYDYGKLGQAWGKFHADFAIDSHASPLIIGPGKLFELLGYQVYQWPGHGTPPDTPYQAVEGEYMKAEEYDLLINDPSDYFTRCYLPRAFSALAPWQALAPVTDLVELPFVGGGFIPFGIPPVQESLQKLLAAGQIAMEWIGTVGAIAGQIKATTGVVDTIGGFSKAPFDILSDTMRGTRPFMIDLYRRPDKVKAAMERLVPLAVSQGIRSAQAGGLPIVFIPLHKGADAFVSDDIYREFYWPTLKAVMLNLIEEGLIPYLFVEGAYNTRLEYLADPELPPFSSVYFFDKTDMTKVKEALGGVQCFAGNVPVSMMKAGTPADVREYVRDLIVNVGNDGGFILSTGGVVDHALPENLTAFVEAGLEFGQY